MPQTELLESFLGGRVTVCIGDITQQAVDAVVNAANGSLLGGGGVDGAIHRAGGPQILEACKAIRRAQWPGGLPAGEVVITTGGRLPAPYVIHTVGPIYGEHAGREAELLAACYRNALALAAARGLTTIAFPAISTGAFGYPREAAAGVASKAIRASLQAAPTLAEVRLVFYAREDANVFLKHQVFAAG